MLLLSAAWAWARHGLEVYGAACLLFLFRSSYPVSKGSTATSFLTRQAPFKFTPFHLTTAKPLRLLLLSDAGPTKENDGAVACGGLDG